MNIYSRLYTEVNFTPLIVIIAILAVIVLAVLCLAIVIFKRQNNLINELKLKNQQQVNIAGQGSQLSDEESKIIADYRKLNPTSKKIVNQTMETLTNSSVENNK